MVEGLITQVYQYIATHNVFITAFAIFLIAMFISARVERLIAKKVTAKRRRSNLGIFAHLFKYGIITLLAIYIIRSYAHPETDYSIIIGLMSASLGFALQKPITSAAGWLIIVLKRPFYIGDRIIVGKVKGDVVDITLSHIVLNEIGGTVSSEDRSGRNIYIPTLILFEENIINYTLTDEYILDEITVLITYESNLEKAEFIIQKSANRVLKAFGENHKKPPYIRLLFEASGISIKARYFVSASKRHEIASDIIRLVHERFRQEEDVQIAYPHIQFIKDEEKRKRVSPKKQKK